MRGGNLGRQKNIAPKVEFPQDTELNCATVEGAKGSFTSCSGFVFNLESLKKGHGQ